MTVALPGQTPAILGFAFPAGLALVLAMTLLATPPRNATIAEDEAAQAIRPPGTTHLYVTLDAPIFVNMGVGTRMRLDIAVSVEGTTAQLLALNGMVDGAQARVAAAISIEAQELALNGADSAVVHAELPARARDALNAMLGDEAFPAPVTEVLIIGLAVLD